MLDDPSNSSQFRIPSDLHFMFIDFCQLGGSLEEGLLDSRVCVYMRVCVEGGPPRALNRLPKPPVCPDTQTPEEPKGR